MPGKVGWQVFLGKVLKGVYTAGVAFLGTLGTALSGNEGFSHVTAQQWTWISLATLVGFGGTFGLAGWSGPKVNGGGGNAPG